MATLHELVQDINALHRQVKQLFDKADENQGDMSADDLAKVKDLNKQIEDKSELAARLKEAKELRGEFDARDQAAVNRLGLGEEHQPRPSAKQLHAADAVLNDPAFKEWLDGLKVNGHVSDRTRIQSPGVQVKTLITSADGSGGAFVTPDRTSIVDASYQRPLTILSLITRGTTTSDLVEYVRQGTPTNAAAPVAEATNLSTGTKPESAMAFSVIQEAVKTIAHWIPVTRRILSDVKQIKMYIETFLRYGIQEELEDQMLTGSGVGENFTGILNVSGTQAQAFDTDLLTTTRKARTKVILGGRAKPTAYVMNPLDWELFDLLKDSEARYYFGGPLAIGTPRLWGVPVVESEGITQGTSVLGDWKYAALWDREQTQIYFSDSHADFFIKNLIAFLAEGRYAFGVIRPSAFVEIDLTA